MIDFKIHVEGEPKGQPRPRAFSRNGMTRMYDPGTADAWKTLVKLFASPHIPSRPSEANFTVVCDFFFPRPKRLYRNADPEGALRCASKPDADNAIKAVLDALTDAGLWRDDAQVVEMHVTKWFHAKDNTPGMVLRVAELPTAGETENIFDLESVHG